MRQLAIALAVLLAPVSTRPALAVLQETDLAEPGDHLVTHDTATGLDWLDVPQTAGLSYDDIRGGAGGWIQSGWRSATEDEICRLFHDSLDPVFDAADCANQVVHWPSWAGLTAVMSLLGTTFADESAGVATRASFDDGQSRDNVGSMAIWVDYLASFPNVDFWASIAVNSSDPGAGHVNVGHLLVRDGSPPHLAWIEAPARNAIVGLVVQVGGTALGDSYTLELRPGGAVDWTLAESGGAVVGGPLGVIDLSEVPEGPVELRLSVVQNGAVAVDQLTVNFALPVVPVAPAFARALIAAGLATLGGVALRRAR